VAVVMNNRSVTEKGKTISKPYTDAENAQITALVKDAMGFDPKRGDSMNLLNRAFNSEPQEALPEVPIWKQPDMIALVKDILKYVLIAGGVGFLLFGIIRPAFKNLAAQAAAQAEAAAAAAEAAKHHHGHGAAQYEEQKNSYEDNLQLAKQLTKDDPKIVASVVKEWVNKE
jgi:flagellar M-ring protein FliF